MKDAMRKPSLLFITGLMLFAAGIVLAIPRPTQAQCGSSASSCKSCHETQGEYPVNTEGDWHTDHAFGDFCEFCHAGNVQATDKEGAHQGLAAPLDDVAASCQGCHPQDLQERSEKYAAILGVELGGGGAPAGGDGGGQTGGNAGTGDSETGGGAVTSVAAPLGGEEIDFNLLYAEQQAPPPLIENWGNVILLVLIAVTAIAFFLTAWTWEGWGQVVAGWINDNVAVVSEAVAEAGAAVTEEGEPGPDVLPTPAELAALFERKPELKTLWPRLAHGSTRLLADLNQILSDEEQGANLLHAVSRLDLKMISAMKSLREKDRELLLALAKEL